MRIEFAHETRSISFIFGVAELSGRSPPVNRQIYAISSDNLLWFLDVTDGQCLAACLRSALANGKFLRNHRAA